MIPLSPDTSVGPSWSNRIGNRNVKGLVIASINVNGLVKHVDEIKLLPIEKNIRILAINETKLDETIEDNIISIDKYKLHRKDCNRHGGGVAIYTKEDISYTIRDHLPNHNLEPICIMIQPFHSEPFDIISWYRPPNDLT